MRQNGGAVRPRHGRRQDVELTLEPDPHHDRARAWRASRSRRRSGTEIALEPRAGRAVGRAGARKDGSESTWTVLGASRGEAGILGEGIRQALLRDPTYAPALEVAAARCCA